MDKIDPSPPKVNNIERSRKARKSLLFRMGVPTRTGPNANMEDLASGGPSVPILLLLLVVGAFCHSCEGRRTTTKTQIIGGVDKR